MKLAKPKCKIRTTYTYDFLGVSMSLEFIPINDVPGYTHKVIADGNLRVGWLGSGFKPSAKTALYFYEKAAPLAQTKHV